MKFRWHLTLFQFVIIEDNLCTSDRMENARGKCVFLKMRKDVYIFMDNLLKYAPVLYSKHKILIQGGDDPPQEISSLPSSPSCSINQNLIIKLYEAIK